jgi:glycosyltransferase involved in cell wall biosynthesis
MRTRALVTFAFRRVNLGLALCDELLDQFHTLIPPAKRGVVANGVNAKPGQRRRFEGLARRDDLQVLFLANTLPSKGLGVVIDALLLLSPLHPNWRLRVCGLWISEFGEDAEAVETNMRARAQPLGPAISFDYASTDSDVVRALSSSDVLVLPTTYSNEGQPLAIIEALVAGLHVVATDHRCISSMFLDEVDGVLLSVPPSPAAVADALESIAAMSPMSERRRLEHEERWSVGVMADAILDLIQRPNAH